MMGENTSSNSRPQARLSRGAGDGLVTSVARALAILATFDLEHDELGVSEIAKRLGLHKTTTHRLLRTLESEGFLSRTVDSRWSLGRKIFELGIIAYEHGGAKAAVLQELGRLVEQTGETAHMAILDGDEVLYVEKVESERALRMPSSIGKRQPFHCTALGKALLAPLPDSYAESLAARPLEAFTSATITDARRLMKELETVRQQGYAVDREEREDGLVCVAAPVRTSAGEVCAAVSVSGPSTRMSDAIDEFAAAVVACCTALSERIGDGLARLTQQPENHHRLVDQASRD